MHMVRVELSFTGGDSPGESSQELLQSGWGKVSTLFDFSEQREVQTNTHINRRLLLVMRRGCLC